MLLLAWQCAKSPTDNIQKLPAPKLLPTPADTALAELGIDAVDAGDFIELDWQPGDSRTPAGYRLYRRSEKETDFSMSAEVGAKISSYVDSVGITVGIRYYYFLTAKDEDNVESEPSDTLSYRLLEKPFQLANTLTAKPRFTWQVSQVPAHYALKLLEADTDRRIWVTIVDTSNDPFEQVEFNFDQTAVVDSLAAGVAYKWRVDVIGPSSDSGSESGWKRFVIP